MTIRRLLTFLFSLAITAIFLVIALYRVDLNQLLSSLKTADYRLVALSVVCVIGSYLLRTARWQRFLRPTKQIPIARLYPVLIVGFALNNLLPGRPGEFARPYWLGARESISKTLGLATIIVERVADGIALIAFLLIALLAFTPLHIDLPPAVETIAVAASILFGVALAGLIFLLIREQLALSIFRFFARFLPHKIAAKLEEMLGSFIVGLHSLKSARDVFAIAILSLAVWLVESTLYFIMLSAFNALPDTLDHAVASVFAMVLINLGVMIPAAPGGVGPYEAAAIFALSAFGVDATLAATVALASHAISYIIITGMGLFFIWRAGMSLAQASTGETETEIEGT